MADAPVTAQAVTVNGAKFAADNDASANVWPYTKLAFGVSGTQTEVADATGNRVPIKVGEPLPAGTNVIGHVIVDTAPTTATTVADGGNVVLGVTTDTAVTGDVTGTISAKLRGLSKILNDVWDSVNHWFKVSIQNATLAVTQSGTWTVQPGNTQNTTPWLVAPQAITTGGCSMDSYLASGAANQDQHTIKAGAGTLYGLVIYNHSTAERFVKVYNVASPTSASTPVLRIGLPANTTGSGNNSMIAVGANFSTQIAIRITTGVADNDVGTVTANDVIVNTFYQ